MQNFFDSCSSWEDVARGYKAKMAANLEEMACDVVRKARRKRKGTGKKVQKDFFANCRKLLAPNALDSKGNGKELRAAHVLAKIGAQYYANTAEHVLDPVMSVLGQVDEIFEKYQDIYPMTDRGKAVAASLEYTLDNLEVAGVSREDLASVVNAAYINSPQRPHTDAMAYVGALIDPERRLYWPPECFPRPGLGRGPGL